MPKPPPMPPMVAPASVWLDLAIGISTVVAMGGLVLCALLALQFDPLPFTAGCAR